MKKVKALQVVHHDTGYHKVDSQFNLEDDIAAELEKEGIVEIIGDAHSKSMRADEIPSEQPEPKKSKKK